MKRKYMKPNLRVINTIVQIMNNGSFQSLGANFQSNPGVCNSNGSRSATWLDDDWYEED